MMIFKNSFFSTFFIMIAFILQGCGSGQIREGGENKKDWVKGEGKAQIYQGDTSLAKDRALRAAKRDAIRRKLGQLIKSKTVTDSGVWVKGEVVAKTEGLVKNYEIVSDLPSGRQYKIEILADVSASDLVDSVEDLIDDWEKPVMFGVVQESFQKKGDPYYNDTLQALEEFFLKKGFILNKTSSLQPHLKPPISTSKIVKVMQKQKAEPDFDLLIFGSSSCKNAGKVGYEGFKSDLISAQVNVSVSIFDIYTQRLIATASEQTAYPHINFETGCSQGLSQKAVPKLGKKIFDQMLKKWGKEYGSGKPLFVELKGKLPYKKLYEFQSILRNEVRGVVDIIERRVSGRQASLEIIYEGKVKDFIEEILHKETNFTITVSKKEGRKIYLTVK